MRGLVPLVIFVPQFRNCWPEIFLSLLLLVAMKQEMDSCSRSPYYQKKVLCLFLSRFSFPHYCFCANYVLPTHSKHASFFPSMYICLVYYLFCFCLPQGYVLLWRSRYEKMMNDLKSVLSESVSLFLWPWMYFILVQVLTQ